MFGSVAGQKPCRGKSILHANAACVRKTNTAHHPKHTIHSVKDCVAVGILFSSRDREAELLGRWMKLSTGQSQMKTLFYTLFFFFKCPMLLHHKR